VKACAKHRDQLPYVVLDPIVGDNAVADLPEDALGGHLHPAEGMLEDRWGHVGQSLRHAVQDVPLLLRHSPEAELDGRLEDPVEADRLRHGGHLSEVLGDQLGDQDRQLEELAEGRTAEGAKRRLGDRKVSPSASRL